MQQVTAEWKAGQRRRKERLVDGMSEEETEQKDVCYRYSGIPYKFFRAHLIMHTHTRGWCKFRLEVQGCMYVVLTPCVGGRMGQAHCRFSRITWKSKLGHQWHPNNGNVCTDSLKLDGKVTCHWWKTCCMAVKFGKLCSSFSHHLFPLSHINNCVIWICSFGQCFVYPFIGKLGIKNNSWKFHCIMK